MPLLIYKYDKLILKFEKPYYGGELLNVRRPSPCSQTPLDHELSIFLVITFLVIFLGELFDSVFFCTLKYLNFYTV